MAEIETPTRNVSEIEQLTPGLVFGYNVWALKGMNGDFARYPFELHGQWAVRAEIIGDEEVEVGTFGRKIKKLGMLAVFNVFSNAESESSLQCSQGVILPRITGSRKQYGTYPIQEGFATPLYEFSIDGQIIENGRLKIPGRNIEPGSLRRL